MASLVAAAIGGDEHAWKKLVDRFSRYVVVVTSSFRLSRQDAEDVSQAVWLSLAINLKSLREPEKLPGWLSTTAKRECMRLVNRGRRTVALDADVISDLPDDESSPEDQAIRKELRQRVRLAFDRLGDTCRILLAMLVSEPPMSYEDVALAIGRSVNSVGPMRQRCLDELRRLAHLPGTNSAGGAL